MCFAFLRVWRLQRRREYKCFLDFAILFLEYENDVCLAHKNGIMLKLRSKQEYWLEELHSLQMIESAPCIFNGTANIQLLATVLYRSSPPVLQRCYKYWN